jgi:uncharacterized protein YggE
VTPPSPTRSPKASVRRRRRVRLGKIIAIEEGGLFAPPRPMMQARPWRPTSHVAPGQTELSASVTITFALD